ncbi:hypothetical protein F5X98DRAFT_371620 [Xylaria grammica]|nr:hypothetical protein F5X98DRAFT_371620 [Xylaria grammica]
MAERSLPLRTRLSNIRGFSDLTLVCHGQKYGLHKAIVCSQSAVMASDLRGGVREATTNFLHAPFDTESIKRLIEFLYTGDYQLSPDPALDLLSSSMSRDSGVDFDTDSDSPKPDPSTDKDEPGTPSSVPEGLACHARMDSIASYYDIPALTALARAKVDEILVHAWSADAFCALLASSPDATGDREYYRLLAGKAVEHADELAARGAFEQGGAAERLTPYMLPLLLDALEAGEARARELAGALARERAAREDEDRKSADRARALDACVQLLNANSHCRNCGIDFACTLEQTSWYHPKHILRCSRCSRRHEGSG